MCSACVCAVSDENLALAAVSLVDVAEVRDGWKTDTFNRISDQIEKTKKAGTHPSAIIALISYTTVKFIE